MTDEHDKPREPEDEPRAAPSPQDTVTAAGPVEASPEEAQAMLSEIERESLAEQAASEGPPEAAAAPAVVEGHEAPEQAEAAAEPTVEDGAPEPSPAEPVHDEAPSSEPEPRHDGEAETHASADEARVDEIGPIGAAAAGATAAAASAPASRPIWSDQGDAPFDDTPEARPVYARERASKTRKQSEGGFFSELWDIIKTVVYALAIAMVVRILFFQPFTIPSASMEPTLYEGDYIVVSKWSYGYSRHSIPWSPPVFEGRILQSPAQRGDIAVFKRPNNNGGGYTDYIKRIIGVPGDRVQMIANVLHINGEPVRDVPIEAEQVRGAFGAGGPSQLRETLPGGAEFRIQDYGPGSPSDDTDVFVVPEGHYFVMGDNRDDSMDSRYPWEVGGVGLVPEENLVGKAQVILFSWTPGASLFNPVSWFANVRPERFFTDLE